MYAIIENGGKQYLINEGDQVCLEKIDAKDGDELTFDRVLMIGGTEKPVVGTPYVTGAHVKATVLNHGLDDKVKVFKKKRRKGYRRTKGHRQHFTSVKINQITAG